jgi:hypothetical protein
VCAERVVHENASVHILSTLPSTYTLLFFIRISCELQKYLPKSNSINVVTGITERKPQTVHNFESIDLSNTIRHKLGFIINTGSSIWAIDFVPQDSSAENPTQYLGVGGYNSTIEHHSLDEALDPINCHNTIQIWSFNSSTTTKQRPRLDMCLLHDYGVVTDFKWCPFSVYEEKVRFILFYFCSITFVMTEVFNYILEKVRHFGCLV